MGWATQRKHKRRHLIYNLAVTLQDSGELLGRLVDINPSGMMIMSSEPMQEGSEYAVKILLDEAPLTGLPPTLELKATCRWCRKSVNPALYDAGFELAEPSAELEQEINRLIARIAFTDS